MRRAWEGLKGRERFMVTLAVVWVALAVASWPTYNSLVLPVLYSAVALTWAALAITLLVASWRRAAVNTPERMKLP